MGAFFAGTSNIYSDMEAIPARPFFAEESGHLAQRLGIL
jgi:hypothetical protein